MKDNLKGIIIPAVLMVIFFCLPALVIAQGGPGGDPDTVPVDGGLSLLAAAGVVYSVKKIKEFRKKKNEESNQENQV